MYYETSTWDGRDALEFADDYFTDEPPLGVTVAVEMFTFRENVHSVITRIREMRAMGHVSLENLYTNDLRVLLASRGER